MNKSSISVGAPPTEQEDQTTGLLFRWTGSDVEVTLPGQVGGDGQVSIGSAPILALQDRQTKLTVANMLADWHVYTGVPSQFGATPEWDSYSYVNPRSLQSPLTLDHARLALWSHPDTADNWARPFLRWSGKKHEEHPNHWEVHLGVNTRMGAEGSVVGPLAYADWNDLPAIEKLYHQLTDTEFWLAVAGLQYSDSIRNLRDVYERDIAWQREQQERQAADRALHIEFFAPGSDNTVKVRQITKALRDNWSSIAIPGTGLEAYSRWPVDMFHVNLRPSLDAPRSVRVAEIIDVSRYARTQEQRILLRNAVHQVLAPIGYTAATTKNGFLIIGRDYELLKRHVALLVRHGDRAKPLAL